ncbi:hypothetical protein GCM10010964_13220 [Caldovatus sediminis]|uniref:Uncharacterized protein n=2 Tax=Caldovatus sediminis TaxID=2041189 RepID=A0A8J3EBJ1_9PROT|nr:hypothetical protein GCM10010964_13220 [Caldovatus sediminis]
MARGAAPNELKIIVQRRARADKRDAKGALALMFVFCSYRAMSNGTARILDPAIAIPPPPRQAIRIGPAPRCRRPRRSARGAIEEALLAFTLGLACAWLLVELALWLGSG